MPLFLGCGAERRPQKSSGPLQACSFPFSPVTGGFGRAQRALCWESNEGHYGAKCYEIGGGGFCRIRTQWLTPWPMTMQISPRGPGIDTDAKQGAELPRNRSETSEGREGGKSFVFGNRCRRPRCFSTSLKVDESTFNQPGSRRSWWIQSQEACFSVTSG